MLSISIIKSSAQAVSYYEKDDYYLNGSRSSPQAKQAELQDDGTSHSEGDLGVGATSSTGAGRGSGGNGTTGSEQSHALLELRELLTRRGQAKAYWR